MVFLFYIVVKICFFLWINAYFTSNFLYFKYCLIFLIFTYMNIACFNSLWIQWFRWSRWKWNLWLFWKKPIPCSQGTYRQNIWAYDTSSHRSNNWGLVCHVVSAIFMYIYKFAKFIDIIDTYTILGRRHYRAIEPIITFKDM